MFPSIPLLALTITGITLLTLLTITLTLLYQRRRLRLRRAQEESSGRMLIPQSGPTYGDPRARAPALISLASRSESTVEVDGGIWPPRDAEGVEGNSAEIEVGNKTGEMIDTQYGVGRGGVKESRHLRVQVVEEEKEDRGLKTSLT